MTNDTRILIKQSPLKHVIKKHGGHFTEESGWEVVDYFYKNEGSTESDTGSLLVDWSHIAKINVRGNSARVQVNKFFPPAKELSPLQAWSDKKNAVLCLADDEFLILSLPGKEDELIGKLDHNDLSLINYTGAMACMALCGPDRDKVIIRSVAMNMEQEMVKPGMVIQTSIHTIPSIVFRVHDKDIILSIRDFSVSLFEALLDVGIGVGLKPGGLRSTPINFEAYPD